MNRDELLTRLAMELAEWPAYKDYMQWDGDDFHPTDYLDRNPFKKHEWLSERERLINKPSWDDAPVWANYLCQQQAGVWCWYAYEPSLELNKWTARGGGLRLAGRDGRIPAGHNWKDTLEKRPDSSISASSDDIAVSDYEDEAFRDCERRLADDMHCPSPSELVNRMLMERCDELQEANARLADENQRLRRIIGEMCA